MQQVTKDVGINVYLHLVDATDGITPETGEAAGQPQVSKNGAAFANTTATLTAIGNGAYYVAITATEANTVGHLLVRYKSANTAEFQVLVQVIAYNPYGPNMGLTNLDAAITSRASPANVLTQAESAIDNKRLDELVIAAKANPVAGSFMDDVLNKDGSMTFDPTTDSLEAIRDNGGLGPTALEIADQVWDEPFEGHRSGGTFGQLVDHKISKAGAHPAK